MESLTTLLTLDDDYVDPLIALAPTPLNLSTIAHTALDHKRPQRRTGKLTHDKVTNVFTQAFLKAASNGDADLIEWLLAKPPRVRHDRVDATPRPDDSASSSLLNVGEARRWVQVDARDDDGTPAIVTAAAFGHAEAVRAIVQGCGESVVDARDAAGWTPLHWAARNGDFTVVSYLVNHGATTDMVSYSGTGTSTSHSLSRSASTSTLASDFSTDSSRIRRTRGLRPFDLARRGPDGDGVRHIIAMAEEAKASRCASPINGGLSPRGGKSHLSEQIEVETPNQMANRRRLEMAVESSKTLQLDFTLLKLHPPVVVEEEDDLRMGTSSPCIEWEEELQLSEFRYDTFLPDQMLILSPDDLPALFDLIITEVDPVRPRSERIVPANALYLSARWAACTNQLDMLDDLLLGALDRIEENIHNRPDNMANCAFWLFNATTLLYYVRRDERLAQLTIEYQSHLADLINEVFVFVIRDAERRIDKILDAGMLEFESLPGFEKIEFEGEGWSFVKAFTTRRSKNTPSKPIASLASVFDHQSPTSPTCSPHHSPRPDQKLKQPHVTSPRTITQLLSSTLFILQLYEIHPSVIVQAFSQIFYWLGCECFNRILSRKKYLCRSKAVQIRINVTFLEDWARTNRLPTKIVSEHFKSLNQLLVWCQCLSSQQRMDQLILLLRDNLSALNPIQVLKVFRDYKFEVFESKMSEECRQYLVQSQQDWERIRLEKLKKVDVAVVDQDETIHKATRLVDEFFGDFKSYSFYSPPNGPEVLSELLDSRHMLPFALPTSLKLLCGIGKSDVFGRLASSNQHDDYPSTLTQHHSPTPFSLDSPRQQSIVELVPILPAGFLTKLDSARQKYTSSHQYSTSTTTNRHQFNDEVNDGDLGIQSNSGLGLQVSRS